MSKEEKDLLVNKFILFYTLRWLWKYYKHSVPELYEALESCGVNRTMYDRILRMEVVNTEKAAGAFERITGLESDYWRGIDQLRMANITRSDWEQYIEAREKRKDAEKQIEKSVDTADAEEAEKTLDVAKADVKKWEAILDDKFRKCLMQGGKQHSSFRIINYFAQHGQREAPVSISTKIDGILEAIGKLEQKDIMGLSNEKLRNYKDTLAQHWKLVDAIYTIKTLKF